MRFVAISVVLVLAGAVRAGPEDAVVRITSHGGSGVVVATGEGWTVVLSASHIFQGSGARRKITIDAPAPRPGGPKSVGVQLVGLAHQGEGDLAVLQIADGPLPYVAEVAPEGITPGPCWSIGYDEMRGRALKRPASIVGQAGPSTTLTSERPWHGRSGGGLIDAGTGYLVGIVSAYEGPSNRAELANGYHGVYASHGAIFRFLRRTGHIRGPSPQQFSQPVPRQFTTPRPCPT